MTGTPDPLAAFDRRIRGLERELVEVREARDAAWGEHAGALSESLAAGRDSTEEHEALREHVQALSRRIEDIEADLRVAAAARRQLVSRSSVEAFEAAEEERTPILAQYRTALVSVGEALRTLNIANAAALRLKNADDALFTRLVEANTVGQLGRLPGGWPHPGPDQHYDPKKSAGWIGQALRDVDLSMELCQEPDPVALAKAARKDIAQRIKREATDRAADERRRSAYSTAGGVFMVDLGALTRTQ